MGFFNIFKKKKNMEDREDFERDLRSTLEFLANLGRDSRAVYSLGLRVKDIRKSERSEVDNEKQKKLLEQEIQAWDKFLEKFVMIVRDTDVAGASCKRISQVLGEEAAKLKVDKSIIQMIKNKDEWNFNW